jgi:hypothetical protein
VTAFCGRERSGSPAAVILSVAKDLYHQIMQRDGSDPSTSFDAHFVADNFAQDDSVYKSSGTGGAELNFQVNDETYFLDLSEDAGRWLVFVETPTGTRAIPVYEDASTTDDQLVLVEDKKRRQIVN